MTVFQKGWLIDSLRDALFDDGYSKEEIKTQFKLYSHDNEYIEIRFGEKLYYITAGENIKYGQYIIVDDMNTNKSKTFHKAEDFYDYLKLTFEKEKEPVMESMKLEEAKEILKKNGFILEDSMSLKDKIANAKRYNDEIKEKKCIIQIIDRWNGVYKGFVGKVGDFVAEYNEAKIFDMYNSKAIKKAVINCLKYAIGEEDLNDLFSEVYIVPLKDGQPDLDSKIEYKL